MPLQWCPPSPIIAPRTERWWSWPIARSRPAARSTALARAATPVALVPAVDGGLNALALSSPDLFQPVFGVPDAAARTIESARVAGIEPAVVDEPLLAFDVDRPSDLKRLHRGILSRAGARA